MAVFNTTYDVLAAISLWYKQRDNEPYVLADIPKLIPLRWSDFKDNWEFIKEDLETRANESFNPDLLAQNLEEMSDFVISQRESKVNPFRDSNILFKFYTIFDLMEVTSLELSKEEEDLIDRTVSAVTRYNRQDFLDARSKLVLERDKLADQKDLSDDDYNRIFYRSKIAPQNTANIADINDLQRIMDSIKTIDMILSNMFQLQANPIDPFQLARDNANNPDIDIQQYASGTLVRFEYGDSLQKLATRYLDDPDKWIDIAIANGLRPPYVDEVGQKVRLLSNGNKTQVNVSGKDESGLPNRDKFFVGQTILMQSNTQRVQERRAILNIEEVPVSGELVLELDGEADLDKYKIAEDAHIRVFKPNTVNSNFFILIPSTEPVDTIVKETPFFLENAADDEKRQGVDLSLNTDADLTFTPSNDLQLSFGLANSIQAVKLKIAIKEGELYNHSAYGLVNITGSTNDELEAIKDALTTSILNQIDADDRFDRVENLQIVPTVNPDNLGVASGVIMNLSVRLVGSGRVIPISFSVATS